MTKDPHLTKLIDETILQRKILRSGVEAAEKYIKEIDSGGIPSPVETYKELALFIEHSKEVL